MATTRTPKKTTAVAVKPATNLVSVQEALKAQLATLSDRITPPTGAMIRATQDKKMLLPDGTKTEGPLNLVVIDFVAGNAFYPNPFDRNNITPPDCYAVGENPKTLTPAANAPNKQAKTCAECPRNEWGSAIYGNPKGKACNNERIMAVLPPDSDANTPLWLLKASTTAVSNFDSYVAEVGRTYQAMPVQMITEVKFNEAETYAQFNFGNPQPNPNFVEQSARQSEARAMLLAERDMSGWKATPTTAPKKTVKR